MSKLNFSRLLILVPALLVLHWPLHAQAADNDPSQRLLQMLDYVGVDYPPTVENGEVVDPVEYAEMEEFSGEIINLLRRMPDHENKRILLADAAQIRNGIDQRINGEEIRRLTQALKEALISNYKVVVGPKKAPDMTGVQALFESNCAACHGVMGYGDGPLANVWNRRRVISMTCRATTRAVFMTCTTPFRWVYRKRRWLHLRI